LEHTGTRGLSSLHQTANEQEKGPEKFHNKIKLLFSPLRSPKIIEMTQIFTRDSHILHEVSAHTTYKLQANSFKKLSCLATHPQPTTTFSELF
jgi:hypothetical protein